MANPCDLYYGRLLVVSYFLRAFTALPLFRPLGRETSIADAQVFRIHFFYEVQRYEKIGSHLFRLCRIAVIVEQFNAKGTSRLQKGAMPMSDSVP